jgi:murein DD-endopeptidase MepM/ murein hydrolase activator NlpD
MKVSAPRNNRLSCIALRLFSLLLCCVLWMATPSNPQAFADELAPEPAPSLARFGNWVTLESFALPGASRPAPGYPFTVVLNWRVLNTLERDLIATVSLNNGGRQYLVQFDALLAAGTQVDQPLSTTHTLLVPEVSPDTTLYFVTQRQKDLPMVMQVAVREVQRNQRVPLTFVRFGRRANTVVLATWRREDLALTECHTTKQLSATNAITLAWPTTGEVTQGYWYAHRGADFADVRGKPVRASAAGQVIMSQWNPDGFGYIVEIEHAPFEDETGPHAFQTLYAHLDQLTVRVGQRVKAGQVIGKLGITGNATGPHLHFEVRLDRIPKNPFCFLPLTPDP